MEGRDGDRQTGEGGREGGAERFFNDAYSSYNIFTCGHMMLLNLKGTFVLTRPLCGRKHTRTHRCMNWAFVLFVMFTSFVLVKCDAHQHCKAMKDHL